MNAPLLEIIDLCHRYGDRQVLTNINLAVAKGEVLAIIGPSGAGKTTLLRLVDLLERPASGKIRFDGTDVTAGKRQLQVRRRMAMVLQKPVVFDASVYDNVACGLRWRGRKDAAARIAPLLELTGLEGLRDRNARTLSGGEAQRVAIARALAVEPELLLLDEPTANLDPLSTIQIEEMVRDVFRRHRPTILFATHDLSQGRRLAGRVAVMANGEIVQAGAVDEVFTSPSSQEVAEFVGFENVVGGVVTGKEGEIATIALGGRLVEAVCDGAPGDPVYACIRSEDVTVSAAKTVTSARNSLAGEVTRVTLRGSLANIEVNCGFPLVALLTRRSAEELDLRTGRTVYASFKATAVHVIRKG